MKIAKALQGINRIFLDTAPVIYLVEAHIDFGARSREIFMSMDESGIQGSVIEVRRPRWLSKSLCRWFIRPSGIASTSSAISPM